MKLIVIVALVAKLCLMDFSASALPSTSFRSASFVGLFTDFPPRLSPVYFCGESVPLHEEAVARRLVSALVRNTNQAQALMLIRQRSAEFFPVIEPILEQHQIPLDFKYLPLVESALRGFAVSRKGAVGYWQFMPATARELGLSVKPGYDERQNLVKSTQAACRYLRYLHDQLGSWTLAAAAYNNGIGALLSNIRRQQHRDYYALRLNAETGQYLYRILAFKELLTNYRHYEDIIPERLMTLLNGPVRKGEALPDDEAILPEGILDEATQLADNAADTDDAPVVADNLAIPLPNAADVFRGGIKAKLVEGAALQRGQTWVFHLTRDGLADGKTVEEGDILYAIIEDIDPKTNRLYLRADKLYSSLEKHTYELALAAVDAATGRLGITLSDIDHIKTGWILTWKTL
jgi:hypothetical protein